MLKVFNEAVMITGFVFVMMLIIEYFNVYTSGAWLQKLKKRQWTQYLVAGILGALPGCLGSYAVVAMYTHRLLTLGAVVAAMIATSGDEAFVMLALIPQQMLLLTVLLFGIGIVAGALTDFLMRKRARIPIGKYHEFKLHQGDSCQCLPHGHILEQWKKLTPFRTTLTVVLVLFSLAVASGEIGPSEWNWVRVSILVVSGVALFIVATVPDHFLQEHLWQHVALKHAPRIFAWTFGTLLLMHFLLENLHYGNLIQDNIWIVLLLAGIIGLIPESGPHLIFVTLFASGTIPFSILLTSSIVQDGHGMLPVLADSRRAFVVIKGINLLVGLAVGAAGLMLGF